MSAFDSPGHKRRGTGTGVSHSKDDALSEVEYERLVEGALRLDPAGGTRLEAVFVVVVLGRLGLRRGELAHMRADWIDWRNEMIQIPRHEPCTKGLEAGEPCGDCRQLAQQRAEHNPGLSMDEALEMAWSAKTDAAAREIYFGFDARVRLYMERFWRDREAWPYTGQAINRRLTKAAEAADQLDPDAIYPHCLRATAASSAAGRGLEMYALMQFFGWSQPSTAEVYLSRSGRKTARQLDGLGQR